MDRTQEHLSDKDLAITGMRAAIYNAIQDVQEGADPPHVVRSAEQNDFRRLRARSIPIAANEDWRTQAES